jgi:Hint domain
MGDAMTNERENSGAGTRRTRRNLMKMGAILVPATLGKIHSAAAKPACDTPFPLINLVCDIVTGNPPGNGGRGGGGGHVNCFLKGTKIRTVTGERKIEELTVNDLLPTVFGGLCAIHWIGRYPFRKSDPSKHWVKDALPVRIARSALAPDVPHADLYVTASHSLLIDGALVPAELLINGTTITRYEAHGHDELEYFHIKLGSHDVIYAEGAPAETLLKVDESAVNFAEYFRRPGAPEEGRCASHVDVWGGRDEFMSRFRSALSPWIDLRNRAEVIRDRLEENGYVFPQEPEIG